MELKMTWFRNEIWWIFHRIFLSDESENSWELLDSLLAEYFVDLDVDCCRDPLQMRHWYSLTSKRYVLICLQCNEQIDDKGKRVHIGEIR